MRHTAYHATFASAYMYTCTCTCRTSLGRRQNADCAVLRNQHVRIYVGACCLNASGAIFSAYIVLQCGLGMTEKVKK